MWGQTRDALAWPRPGPGPLAQLRFQRNLPEPVSSSVEWSSRCPHMHPETGGKHTRNHKRGKMAGSPGGLWAGGSTGSSWAGFWSSHCQGTRAPPVTQIWSTFPVKTPLVFQPHPPARTPKLATPCSKLCLSGELLLILQNPRRGVPSSEMSHGAALRTKQEHACVNTRAWLRGGGSVLTAVLVTH